MKGLTLTQPWATLIALGLKRIETRSWMTHYRGPVAIHAAKLYPLEAKLYAEREPVRGMLKAAGLSPRSLPQGSLLAIAQLVAIRPTSGVRLELLREDTARNRFELHVGDYTIGRWAWILDEVHKLPWEISVRGMQGLWDVPADAQRRIETAMRNLAATP